MITHPNGMTQHEGDERQAEVTDAPGWGVEINPAWLDKAEYRVSQA